MDEPNEQNSSGTPPGKTLIDYRFENVDYQLKTLDEDVRELKEEMQSLRENNTDISKKASELEIYITNILSTVQGLSTDFKNLDELSSKRHETQQEKWTGLFSKLLYMILGSAIAYAFSNFL